MTARVMRRSSAASVEVASADPPLPYYRWSRWRSSDNRRHQVRRGTISLPPHPPLTVIPYQWRALPTTDRNWRFGYAALSFLRGLLATDDRGDWREAMRWIRAWSLAHRGRSRTDAMAWYPHGAALRTLVLASAYHQGLRRGVAAADLALLEDGLERHRRFLADPRHFEPTNHGLTEALALIDAHRLLAWRARTRERQRRSVRRRGDLLARGLDRLLGVLDLGISAAGVHMEGAPGYHLYFLEQAVPIVQYLCETLPASLRNRLGGVPGRLARMHDNMWFLTDVHGRLPPVGDTELADPQRTLAAIGRRLEALAAAAELPPAAAPRASARREPGTASILYDEESGFAVFKEVPGRYAVFRIQDRVPPCHAHNDALSLIFQLDGIDVFCDAGKYSYNHDDPIRRHLVGRFAHNTAEVRDAGVEDYVLAGDRARLAGPHGPGFAATAVVETQGFTHRRTVRFPRGAAALHVVDELRGPRGYLLKWHLGSALRLRPAGATARTARFASPAAEMVVEVVADHDIDCTIGPSRPGDPPGWRSERWGQRTACPVLLVRPRRPAAASHRVETAVLRTASGPRA